jgi:hypothetical protein
MAINYKDTRRREVRVGRDRSRPILAVILLVGGLLWLGPQSAAMFERVTTALKLPTY